MNNIRFNENEDFKKTSNDILDNELFSLKFTDSLYKKDIGKFLEFLSSYLIWFKETMLKPNKDLHTKT